MRNRMSALLLALGLVTFPLSVAVGQDEEFPLKLPPGESFENPADSGKSYWIMTDAAFRRAVQTGLEHENLTETVELLDRKAELQVEVAQARADQLQVLQDGYDFYRTRYQDALDELEAAELELSRERGRRRTLSAIGFGVALLGGGVALGLSLGG